MRSCIACSVLVEHGSYCTQHNPSNGYRTPAHRRARAQARALTGTRCPECGRVMDSTNPPQAAHLVALTLGGRSIPSNYESICRDCNLKQRGKL